MTGYINKFENKKTTVTISPWVNDEQRFKQNKIWKKVEKLMRIDFESKPTHGYDGKNINTKIKTHADSIITNFHNKKMPKEKVPCKCISINNNARFCY